MEMWGDNLWEITLIQGLPLCGTAGPTGIVWDISPVATVFLSPSCLGMGFELISSLPPV